MRVRALLLGPAARCVDTGPFVAMQSPELLLPRLRRLLDTTGR